MTKPQNIESIEKATKKSWEQWQSWLADRNAGELNHAGIAKIVHEELEGKVDNPGWWAQGIAVAYEQAIGRRAPGQRSDGSYEVSISTTRDGQREDTFAKCLDLLTDAKDFDGKDIENVRTSVTPVRSYWRCNLEDGSKITWAVEQKTDAKVLLVVTHTNLQTAAQSSSWRDFWKSYLENM